VKSFLEYSPNEKHLSMSVSSSIDTILRIIQQNTVEEAMKI
jgi:hypothetical protein